MDKANTPAAHYERFLVTGRGTILVPRSKEAIANKLEIDEKIIFENKIYLIRGLEISRSLMSIPKELSRAYKVIQVGIVDG